MRNEKPERVQEAERLSGKSGQTLEGKVQGIKPEQAGTTEDWLWLCGIPGLYRNQRAALLSYFETPGAIRNASGQEFKAWEKVGCSWIRKLYPCLREEWLETLKKEMDRKQIGFIAWTDPEYPEKLGQIIDFPYGLFVKGKLSFAETPAVAVVGSRTCSEYGARIACELGTALAEHGILVVSGLAAGVDGIAQTAALGAGGKSAAVLGCGADICYPAQNRNLYHDIQASGVLLSEYPPGTPPLRSHFPERNRIISGLSDVTVVVEARVKSGSLITADFALEQGRDVMAVPGRSTDNLSGGCNRLIDEGAGILLSPERFIGDLMERYPEYFAHRKRACSGKGRNGKKETDPEHALAKKGCIRKNTGTEGLILPDREQKIYGLLDVIPVGLEELTRRSGLDPGEVIAALLRLQLSDLVTETAKNRYRLL